MLTLGHLTVQVGTTSDTIVHVSGSPPSASDERSVPQRLNRCQRASDLADLLAHRRTYGGRLPVLGVGRLEIFRRTEAGTARHGKRSPLDLLNQQIARP